MTIDSWLGICYIEQVKWIQWLQSFRTPGLDSAMQIISICGEGWFYVVGLVFIFCAIHSGKAMRVAIALFFSFWLNSLLKVSLGQPRPFQLGNVTAIAKANGNGFPSGHAQASLVAGWMLVRLFPSRLLQTVVTGFVIAMALSRVYLGDHFPSDILGGWLLAGAILLFDRLGYAPIMAAMDGVEPQMKFRLVTVLTGIGIMGFFSAESAFAMGLFFGLCAGWLITQLRKGSSALAIGRTEGERWIALTVSLVGAAAIYFGLQSLTPTENERAAIGFLLLRTAAAAAWVSAGVPLLRPTLNRWILSQS